jgi:hypothetical protein
MELTTSTHVDAPPETVWRVLTDFDEYPEWNPFLRVTGRANEGAHLSVELRPPGRRATTFRPTVTRVESGRELRWLGHLLVPGIYDGEHRFRVDPEGDGSRLTQSERFEGLLVGVVNRWLGVGASVEAGFEAMNGALKSRAEAMAGGTEEVAA